MQDYKNKGKWTDIQVHLTNYCELSCQHCYTNSKFSSRIWLEEDAFIKILEFAKNVPNSIIRLIGGEVITRQLEVLKYLKISTQYDVPLILSTSGFYHQVFTSKIVDPNIFKEIILSCYGIGLQHDLVTRTKDSFNNFKYLIDYFNSFQRNFELTVNTMLLKQNQDNFIDILIYLHELGIDEIKILALSPLGKIKNYQAWNEMEADNEVKLKLYEKIFDYASQGKFGSVKLIIENPFFSNIRNKCKINKRSMITIDHLGNIFPCHLLINKKAYSIGNIKEELIEDIIRRDFMINFDNYSCLAYEKTSLNGLIAGCPLSLELIN